MIKTLLFFVFLYLFIISIKLKKEVVVMLLLVGIFFYFNQTNHIVNLIKNQDVFQDVLTINSSSLSRLDYYNHYSPKGFAEFNELYGDFEDNVSNFNRNSLEIALILKRKLMNSLLAISMTMTNNPNDESRFIDTIKEIETLMNSKIKKNYQNNQDIILHEPGQPEPRNSFEALDIL
jgi:hypothetical protein